MIIDPAELLLAAVGLSPFIDGDPPKITIGLLAQARDLPQTITEKAMAVTGGTLRHTPVPRPHSYTALLDRMTRPLPPHELEKVELSFAPEEHDLSTKFTVFVQATYRQLQTIFPLAVVQSYAGSKNITPSDDRIFQFFNQFALLNKPMRVFDLIGSGSLLRSQARSMRAIYPTLSAAVDAALQDAANERKAEKPNFTLPPPAEYGVSVWSGKRALDFKPPAPPPGQAPTSTPGPTKGAAALETNAQKTQGP